VKKTLAADEILRSIESARDEIEAMAQALINVPANIQTGEATNHVRGSLLKHYARTTSMCNSERK
jgi:hypothetical protein